MILRLGGHLSFYAPQKETELEIEVQGRTALADLLQRLHVPVEEVALVVINGEQIELSDATISDQDQVQLFPPIGGGDHNNQDNLDQVQFRSKP
jgi:sulfur carrier protein ThiS